MGKRTVVAAVAFVIALLLGAAPAWAVFTPGDPPGTPRAGVSSEIVMSGTGEGQGVDGFIGPVGSRSDPTVPYPPAPPEGFLPQPEGFAGIIHANPTGGGPPLS